MRMAAKTTIEMIDAIQRAAKSGKTILSDLQEVMTDRAISNFGAAMEHGGAGRAVAEEHHTALEHSMMRLEEDIHTMLKELGVAEHIVSFGVHKTPIKQGRNHLVL